MFVIICEAHTAKRENHFKILSTLAKERAIPIRFRVYGFLQELLGDYENFEEKPDLMVIDTNLPDGSGILLAAQLRGAGYTGEYIFVSPNEDYWRQAFELNAGNYLLYHDEPERIKAAFANIVHILTAKKGNPNLFFKRGKELICIKQSDIKYISVKYKVLYIHYKDSQYSCNSTLSAVESKLEEGAFIRVHRSFLVSLNFIDKCYYDRVVLRDGTNLPISRGFKSELCNVLQ